jgi:dihydroxy-acid dehydratase
VFDSEEEALKASSTAPSVAGDVVVIRYEGPKGGPGMREMLAPPRPSWASGLGKDVALITDGRFSGGSHGFVVGHITKPRGLPLSTESRELTLEVDEAEIRHRLAKWSTPPPRYTRGVLAKYAHTVRSASEGAVTDRF